MALTFVLFLRLIFPLFILRLPLFGFIGSLALDFFDYGHYQVTDRASYQNYVVLDKLLDTYFLSLALIVALSWKDKIARQVSLITYLYRLPGVAGYLITKNELSFVIFPNFFETFFIFFLVFKLLKKKQNLFRSTADLIILLPLFVPKILHEVTHILPLSYPLKNPVLLSAYLIFSLIALIWRFRT